MNPRRLSTVVAAAVATSALVAPVPAHADTTLAPYTSIPAAMVRAHMSTTAATGTRLVRATTAGAQYSLDNGATWRALPSDMTGTMLIGTAGRFIDVIQKSLPPADDEDDSNPVVSTAFQVFDPATGAVTTLPGHLGKGANEYPERISDAAWPIVAFNGGVFDISGTFSGPYTLGRLKQNHVAAVTRVDGVKLGTASALFGSLAATQTPTGVSVRNLTQPSQTPITADFPESVGTGWEIASMWGDSIAFRRRTDATSQTLVLNYRTKETRVFDGDYPIMDDGFVLTRELDRSAAAWRLSDGARLVVRGALGEDTDSISVTTEVTTDGIGRVAWIERNGTIQIANIPGVGTTAPRLLGLLAPTSLYANGTNLWKPQADFSKRIKAGTFVITNSSGKVVRTITTTDARRGSLRNGLNWNGRNDAGTLVPAGTYGGPSR